MKFVHHCKVLGYVQNKTAQDLSCSVQTEQHILPLRKAMWYTVRSKCAKTLVQFLEGIFFGVVSIWASDLVYISVHYQWYLFLFPFFHISTAAAHAELQLAVSHRWCNPPFPPPLLLSLSAMATYPPTCSNTNTSQGMNMANSIANLRLKAKEYSLNQVPTVNWEEERPGKRSAAGPPRTDTVSGSSIISHTPDREAASSFSRSSPCGDTTPICKKLFGHRALAGCFSKAAFFFFIFKFFFLFSWASLNSTFVQKNKRHLDWML